MGKINDTTAYPNTAPALTDHVPGTDVSNTTNDAAGETVTFTLQAIMDLIEANASVDLSNFTITGTKAQFNTALSDGSFQYTVAEGAFVDGDKTKLDGIEASADVTDATNVASAGAVMADGSGNDITGDLVFTEKADHSSTPGAGKGYLWVKNTAPSSLIFTDDGGTDTTLGAAGGGISNVVEDTTPQLGGDLDTNDFGLTLQLTNDNAGAITIGEPVYIKSNGNVDLADADAASTTTSTVGLVADASIASAGTGAVCFAGVVGDFDTSGLTAGALVYIATGTAGVLTSTEPTAVGAQVKPIGICLESHATTGRVLVLPFASPAMQATAVQSQYVPAGSMISRTTSGAAANSTELATNDVMLETMDFDASADEFAQFSFPMPANWDGGTITYQVEWSHASTATNFGVTFGLQAVGFADGDAMDAAFGTAVLVDDTGGTTDDHYLTPESSAVTIAGSPAAGESVHFQLYRDVSDANDDLAVDARVKGVRIFYNITQISEE